MKFSNLHTHTTFSDGKGTVRENVISAIERGMVSLGFSDHSFTGCDTSYCMLPEDYGKYKAEVLAAREEFGDRISIFHGIEKDYFSTLNPSDYDYIIASVHYIIEGGKVFAIDHGRSYQDECVEYAFGGDSLAMAKRYFSMVAEQARLVKPDIIGHFDVINKFGMFRDDEGEYYEIAADAMRETLRYCKRFEVNTGAIARGYKEKPYPSPKLLSLLCELGGEVVLGSDSHRPENLDFYFGESVELIRAAGFKSISRLTYSGFESVEI